MSRILALMLTLFVACLAIPLETSAQESTVTPDATAQNTDGPPFTISVEPGEDPSLTEKGYFVFELKPKVKGAGSVLLQNPTQTDATIELIAVDARTAQNGNPDYALASEQSQAVGTWIHVEESRVTLAPGESRSVSFTVSPPAKTQPGQYLGGLVAYIPVEDAHASSTPGASQMGASVLVQTRYITPVRVDVPGDWNPSLVVMSVDAIHNPNGTLLVIALQNDGDTFLKPKGALTVTDDRGAVVLNQPIEMGTFVTRTDATYSFPWPGGPPLGAYTTHVDLTYGDDQTATYDGALVITDDADTVVVSAFDVTEVRDQNSNDLQNVNVAIVIDNPAAEIPNARLTLHVTRDGQPVEDLELASSLTIQSGPGEISQRYFPPSGWTPGSYTFSISIETVDPASGDAIVILTSEATTTIVVE